MGWDMTALPDSAGDASAGADTSRTRMGWSLLTDPEAQRTWEYVTHRVTKALIGRGCQPADARDLCQDAGLRAVECAVLYSTAEELVAWCLTVSRRLLIDDHRRAQRRRRQGNDGREPLGDVEAEALARIRVTEVLSGLRQLTPDDREALLTERRPIDRRDSNRMAIRRHRARARLTKIIGCLVTGLWAGCRRVQRGVAGPTALAASCVTVLAVLSPALGIDRAHDTVMRQVPGGVSGVASSLPETSRPKVVRQVGAPHRTEHTARRTSRDHEGTQRTVIEPPGSPQGVYHETREKGPADRLACADNLPFVERVCTPL